ncbi:MAG TPA: hypothetical protein VM529_20640 [Gemmata sp.]|jgi:hypothetical protein|nr:hypothetical protein [Gemmata sp.]
MCKLLSASVIVAVLVFGTGCGRPAASNNGGAAGSPGFKPASEVTLTEGGVADIDRAAKDTKDAAVLVEFWSLATEPSPDLALSASNRGGNQQARGPTLGSDKVAWHGVRKGEYMGMKYGDYFYRVILVNVDGPEKRDEVLKFLKQHDARHTTNIAWKDDPAAAAERYGFAGKVPHQALFGRDGKRVWATGEPLDMPLDDRIFRELDK